MERRFPFFRLLASVVCRLCLDHCHAAYSVPLFLTLYPVLRHMQMFVQIAGEQRMTSDDHAKSFRWTFVLCAL